MCVCVCVCARQEIPPPSLFFFKPNISHSSRKTPKLLFGWRSWKRKTTPIASHFNSIQSNLTGNNIYIPEPPVFNPNRIGARDCFDSHLLMEWNGMISLRRDGWRDRRVLHRTGWAVLVGVGLSKSVPWVIGGFLRRGVFGMMMHSAWMR